MARACRQCTTPIDNFYVTDETDGLYDVLPSYFASETANGAHFSG